MTRFAIWVATVVMATGTTMSAQETRYRSGVDLVALNVVATDGQGRLISGLISDDFEIFEDGAPQQVTFFAASQLPIDLGVLLDTSSSMADKISTVQAAAVGFVSAVRPGDRVTVVDIKDTVKVLHPLNGDVDGARTAIQATFPKGNTSLFNGLYKTLKEMVKQRAASDEPRRQAIVLLSDGEDTTSLIDYDVVSELAKESGVAIYTITLRSPFARNTFARTSASNSEAEYLMKELAMLTGARAFFPAAISELAGVYGSIAEELASQYSMGYSSSNPKRDGAFRRIDVRIGRPGIRARTRTGYVEGSPTLATR
jgi:Ca-activated chloride channel family protein